MWAYLGGQTLDVLTVTGFSLDHGWRYAEHAVIQGKPKLQATGTELRTGRVKARLHGSLVKPDTVLDALKAAANRAEALTFQRGDGQIVGRFVIEGLSEDYRQTFPDGQTLAVEVTLKLREWAGADAPQAPARPAVPGSSLGQAAPAAAAPEGDAAAVPASRIVRR